MAVAITRTGMSARKLRAAAAKTADAKAARRMLALALVLEGTDRKTAAETGRPCATGSIATTPKRLQVLLPSLTPRCIGRELVTSQAQLSPNKTDNPLRDDLARRKKSTRISQGAELQGKANPVLRPAPFVDVYKVVVSQRVVMKDQGLVSG